MISLNKSISFLLGSAMMASLYCTTSLAEEGSDIAALADIAQQAGAIAESGSLGELFNINNASPEMLAKIPGVGETLGQAIVSYREANGAFTQLQDLLKVEGIDAALLEKIKPFLQL